MGKKVAAWKNPEVGPKNPQQNKLCLWIMEHSKDHSRKSLVGGEANLNSSCELLSTEMKLD